MNASCLILESILPNISIVAPSTVAPSLLPFTTRALRTDTFSLEMESMLTDVPQSLKGMQTMMEPLGGRKRIQLAMSACKCCPRASLISSNIPLQESGTPTPIPRAPTSPFLPKTRLVSAPTESISSDEGKHVDIGMDPDYVCSISAAPSKY